MTARSVLLSALLGEVPPRMPVRRLVRVAALFGINDNQARVALSRMARRGEVTADGEGRYELAGRLRDRAARLALARTGARGAFDGSWHLAVVVALGDTARVRAARRAALRAARLGELRDGVWLRPANLELRLDERAAQGVERLTAVPEGDSRTLVATVFDLAGWARRARALCDELDATVIDGPDGLAAGFVRNAEVLRHLQRDPLVPDELAPPRWPGSALRDRFEEFDARYRAMLRDAHRTAASAPAR